MKNPTCPICAQSAIDIGPIVHPCPALVAGVPIDLDGIRFRMMQCTSCALQFKDPLIPMEKLLPCYNSSPENNWEHQPNPIKRRFDQIAALAKQHARGTRILDIGCSNGAILDYFGSSWDRYGVEPGQDAARVAQQRDISILAPLLEDLDPSHTFDAILAIDLLEHLHDPNAFIARIMAHLNTGGIFIGFTGTTDAPSFRLQGSRYWYASLPEHLVFYCKETIEHLAKKHNATVEHYERTSHIRASLTRIPRDTIRNLIWKGVYACKGFAIAPWRHKLNNNPPPGWLSANDHMLFVLRKQ